jgi:glycosidase
MNKHIFLSVGKILLMMILVAVSFYVPVQEEFHVDANVSVHTDVGNKVNFSTDVIYQIVTDRFHDGDPTNNPTGELYDPDCDNLRKYCGGDWQGITDKINDGYLTEMGISALWISPPVENIFATLDDEAGTTSYHGYWARDYVRTNPFFGDFGDFEELVSTAHANDMKVVIDFAPNHTSPASEDDPSYAENGVLYHDGQYIGAYSDSPNGLFLYNGGTDFSDYEDEIYRNLFDLASFNLQNEQIDNLLKEAIEKWLDLGVDGIRVDAVAHMPLGWQKTFVDTIYDHAPVYVFGEWFTGEAGNEHYQTFANESGMHVLDFRFAQTARNVLRDGSGTMYDLEAMLADTETYYDRVNDQATFLDNHDMDRFTVEGAPTRLTDIGLAFSLTSRGAPIVYYGTEQYVTGTGDPGSRKPMPAFERDTTAYQVIQNLAPLRKDNPALAYGTTKERWINDDVLIYERAFNGNYALVAINRNVNTSYPISGLVTDMPAGTYADELNELLDGQSLTVNRDGSAAAFHLSAGEVSVWQYTTSSFSPKIGTAGPYMAQPGHTMTISGTGFGSIPGSVSFGSNQADIVSWNDTVIEVTVPSVAASHYDLTVTAANQETSSSYPVEVLTGDQLSVRFIVNNAETSWGENVYLVGNVHELGSWSPEHAVGPMFNQIVYQYPTWYYDVNVPAGTTMEFKFVKIDASGNVTWENGANHVYTSPADGTDTVMVDFQN